jgi:hypothetical protein
MNNVYDYRRRFDSLLESTLGNVKPLISEANDTGWGKVYAALSNYKNPKTETGVTKTTTLRWGLDKVGSWNLSINSNGTIMFLSDKSKELKIFENSATNSGFSTTSDDNVRSINVNYTTDASNVIKFVKSLLDTLPTYSDTLKELIKSGTGKDTWKYKMIIKTDGTAEYQASSDGGKTWLDVDKGTDSYNAIKNDIFGS